MDINDNTFTNNEGSESCIFINSNSKIEIQRNIFTGNYGIVLSSAESYASVFNLERNEFNSNNDQAILVKRATVNDIDSVYLSN